MLYLMFSILWPEGDLRLHDGTGATSQFLQSTSPRGRLMIYHSNEWRSICDDMDNNPAKVKYNILELIIHTLKYLQGVSVSVLCNF